MKLHPATIPLRSLGRAASLGFVCFLVGLFLSPGANASTALVVLWSALGVCVALLYEGIRYFRVGYTLTPETLRITAGILSRRTREIPRHRIQSVDIHQSLFLRPAGLATIRVETAGGSHGPFTLEYVSMGEATRIRDWQCGVPERQCTTTVHGREQSSNAGHRGSATESETIFTLKRTELIAYSITSVGPGAVILCGIALSFISGRYPRGLVAPEVYQLGATLPKTIQTEVLVVAFLVTAWALSAGLHTVRFTGFRLTRSQDVLHYEHGLYGRYSGTIPLENLQRITIAEPIPLRWLGYGSLQLETAGSDGSQQATETHALTIPLASRKRIDVLLGKIAPLGGLDSESIESPPRRAKTRYILTYLVAAGLGLVVAFSLSVTTPVVRDWYALAPAVLIAPIAAHLKWSNRGYQLQRQYLLTRDGFWHRRTCLVPYQRIQSLAYTQRPLQRHHSLATLTADTASVSPAIPTAYDVDAERGNEVCRRLERQMCGRSGTTEPSSTT
ncbi:PH domain-containing protein [Natrialbaceae archaeon A-CW2]